jgi:hypothetical protein
MTPMWGSTIEGLKITGHDPHAQPRAVVYEADLLRSLPRSTDGAVGRQRPRTASRPYGRPAPIRWPAPQGSRGRD